MHQTFQSKLVVPIRRKGTIRRQYLLERLNDLEPGAVALARSPAGFGKTTLLVDFCEQAPDVVFWLSLDAWDRDWSTLANYLLLATGSAGDIESEDTP